MNEKAEKLFSKDPYQQPKQLPKGQYRHPPNKELQKRVTGSFSIVSHHCWGGLVYQELERPYTSPFMGIVIFAPCYLKILKDLKRHVYDTPFKFIRRSRYQDIESDLPGIKWVQKRNTGEVDYPIALLNDSEVHFLHYHTEQDAEEKWKRRADRMDWDNLRIQFSDIDYAFEKDIREFDALPYSHKICFSVKEYPDLKSVVWLERFKDKPYIPGCPHLNDICKEYMDLGAWLNGESSWKVT